MSTETANQAGQRQSKKPRRLDNPAAPTRQEENSPSIPNSDDKASGNANQAPHRARNGHSESQHPATACADKNQNPRLDGIHPDDYLISNKEVVRRTGLSRGTVEYLMQTADFPLPLKLGAHCVRWWSREVDQWILSRERAKGDLGKRHSKIQEKPSR